MSSMTALEKWIDDAIQCFIERMHEKSPSVTDLGLWLQLLAFGEGVRLQISTIMSNIF